MSKRRTYRMVWVKAAPHTDPVLVGKAVCRKPHFPSRVWDEVTPQREELTPQLSRLLATGSLVEVDPPAIERPMAKGRRSEK